MWPEYIHHITVHFPLVMSFVLAVVGVWSVVDDAPQLRLFVRWGGWLTFLITTVAVISGIVSTPGWLGGEGPSEIADHRNLGLTTWFAMAAATIGFDYGVRHGEARVRNFGAVAWIAVVVGVIGTAHWGGAAVHSDRVPWMRTPPVITPEDVSDR